MRGLLVKYPANKLNSYREKVISALRAKDKWLCKGQFLATFAALILKKSFSGSCSSDFRRKFFSRFRCNFVIFDVAISVGLWNTVFVSSRKESNAPRP